MISFSKFIFIGFIVKSFYENEFNLHHSVKYQYLNKFY